MPKLSTSRSSAETLISLLIAIALFGILSRALFTLVSSSYSIISFTSARITAKQLAQEKLESIRNLPYDSIGTVGGIPSGPIPQLENVVRNGLNYEVRTSIIYIDDPFDGLAPDDLLPTDYKSVRVDVSWSGHASSSRNPVTFITYISPKGVESTAGGGTLSILVFDANAQPVGQADVLIVADQINPAVNLSLQTADNGRVILPGATPCNDCYQITVSKDGYSSQRTYSSSEVENPNKPHVTVLQGQLTEVSFAIDKTSQMSINTFSGRDDEFSQLGNVTLNIRGDKTIGTDGLDEPVYKFQQTVSTNPNGFLSLGDLEWDNYYITLPPDSSFVFSGTNPLLPINLNPDTNISALLSFEEKFENSSLLTFVDISGTQIASVSAFLFDNDVLVASHSSGLSENPDFGQILFNNLAAGLYQLIVTASGYIDFSGDLPVFGNDDELIMMQSQ